MWAGSGRAGGLTDVARAQLERWQDHPNTGRDARVDAFVGWRKRPEKKKTAIFYLEAAHVVCSLSSHRHLFIPLIFGYRFDS